MTVEFFAEFFGGFLTGTLSLNQKTFGLAVEDVVVKTIDTNEVSLNRDDRPDWFKLADRIVYSQCHNWANAQRIDDAFYTNDRHARLVVTDKNIHGAR